MGRRSKTLRKIRSIDVIIDHQIVHIDLDQNEKIKDKNKLDLLKYPVNQIENKDVQNNQSLAYDYVERLSNDFSEDNQLIQEFDIDYEIFNEFNEENQVFNGLFINTI